MNIEKTRTISPEPAIEIEFRPHRGGGKKNDGFSCVATEPLLGSYQVERDVRTANRRGTLSGAALTP